MSSFTRRKFVVGAAALTTAACGNGINTGANGVSRAAQIDARADAMLKTMYEKYPGTKDLRDKSVGQLVMPLITKAGFGVGGAYGRGVLRINNSTVDYYSTASATFGFQVGAQQFSHVLFFMTNDALGDFRRSSGWAAGADLEYAIKDKGGNISAETTTATAPVIAVIFGQAGFQIGATLEGQKYTRIIP